MSTFENANVCLAPHTGAEPAYAGPTPKSNDATASAAITRTAFLQPLVIRVRKASPLAEPRSSSSSDRYIHEMSGTVARISIAPVKSLGLVHPDEIEIGPRGVVGNRRFWLVDDTGRLFNNKRCGPMVRIRPEWDEQSRVLALTLPDGERVEGVVELGEPVAGEMYRNPHPSRHVIGPWEDAISRIAGQKLTLLWAEDHATDRGWRGGDISLVSRASLDRLGREGGADGPIDGRRFRLLLEIDGVEEHAEDEWLGTQVQVGEAVLQFNGDIGRC